MLWTDRNFFLAGFELGSHLYMYNNKNKLLNQDNCYFFNYIYFFLNFLQWKAWLWNGIPFSGKKSGLGSEGGLNSRIPGGREERGVGGCWQCPGAGCRGAGGLGGWSTRPPGLTPCFHLPTTNTVLRLRIRDVYPGCRIQTFSIPDPVSEFFHPGSRIRIFPSRIPYPNFSIPDPGSASSILTQKIVSKLSEIWSGLFILDPDPEFLPSRFQGSKRHRITDPQHCIYMVTAKVAIRIRIIMGNLIRIQLVWDSRIQNPDPHLIQELSWLKMIHEISEEVFFRWETHITVAVARDSTRRVKYRQTFFLFYTAN